jgi:deoxyadenosine/deoxycytidine kinase
MPIVSIEGNIASGKTTHLKLLESAGYTVHYDDSHEQSDLASKYYNDMKRYSLGYHLRLLRNFSLHAHTSTDAVHIYENSPYTLKHVHCELLHEKRCFDEDEYKIYDEYNTQHGWMPDVMIYLYCHPSVCHDRLMPAGQVKSDHILDLHAKYEIACDDLNITDHVKLYKINSQEDIDTVYRSIIDIIKTL